MRPLVQATVADGTGRLAVTFFNQPWLVARYPPGTRLVLHGKPSRPGASRFRRTRHQRGDHACGGGPLPAAVPPRRPPVAHYPATDGLTSTQILALVQRARWPPSIDVARAAAGLVARP